MEKCEHCKKKWPGHLLSPLMIGDEHGQRSVMACGICALKLRNESLGLPEGTPFQGEQAQKLYDEAVEYLLDN